MSPKQNEQGQPLSHRWETAVLLHIHPIIESRQVFDRAGKLHHGALLIRSLDAVTYRTIVVLIKWSQSWWSLIVPSDSL
jgi:hypothetical protein